MVLDGVIGSLGEDLGHFGPFAAIEEEQKVQEPLLVWCPLCFIDVGVEMIVPPFATLLTHSVRNELGNKRPSFSAILFNDIH